MATIQLGAAIQRGLAAGKPSSGDAAKAGQLYFETDTGILWHDDGSTWEEVGADSSGLAAHLADTADAHDAGAVSFAPAAGIAATDVQAAIVEDAGDLAAHLADSSAAHAASAIAFTPNGSIAATDVQAAIQEVRDEAGGGVTTFAALTDVDVTGLGAGDLLRWNGTDWVIIDATGHAGAILRNVAGTPDWSAEVTGATTYDELLDVDATGANAPADLDVPIWDAGAARWIPGAQTGGGAIDAADVAYDNAASGLSASDAQTALDELAAAAGGGVGTVLTTTGDLLYVGPSITPGDDVALGKTTSASVASGTGGTNSGNLVDGSSGTYWSTVGLGGSPQHATVDLGAEIEATGFALMQFGSGYEAATVKVQGSHDNATFTDIPGSAVSPTNSGSLQPFSFTSPVTYRYYRLHILTDNGTPAAGTGIKQFSVYASGALVLARLAAGTPGQVLTMTTVGSDVLPRWA